MSNIGRILKNVKKEKHPIDEKNIVIKGECFNINSIYQILERIKWIHDKKNTNINIIIETEICEYGALSLFEIIIYNIIIEKEYNIYIHYNFKNIDEFLRDRFVYKYNDKDNYENAYRREYEFYTKGTKIEKSEKYQYIKICQNNKNLTSKQKSMMINDMLSFADPKKKYNLLDEKNEYYLVKIIMGIAENAFLHTDEDFMIFINIQKINSKLRINVVMLYFDEINFGTRLMDCLKNRKIINKKVNEAYQKYIQNPSYDMDFWERFLIISVFQKNVTTKGTDGNGLTEIIESLRNLMEQMERYNCYLISGKTYVKFDKKCLKYDSNGTIAFSEKTNYENCLKDDTYVKNLKYNITTNMYNLSFEKNLERSH